MRTSMSRGVANAEIGLGAPGRPIALHQRFSPTLEDDQPPSRGQSARNLATRPGPGRTRAATTVRRPACRPKASGKATRRPRATRPRRRRSSAGARQAKWSNDDAPLRGSIPRSRSTQPKPNWPPRSRTAWPPRRQPATTGQPQARPRRPARDPSRQRQMTTRLKGRRHRGSRDWHGAVEEAGGEAGRDGPRHGVDWDHAGAQSERRLPERAHQRLDRLLRPVGAHSQAP